MGKYINLYPNLFTPLQVKNVVFKNRIFSGPCMIYQTMDGVPTEYYRGYLEHKARGGAAQVALGEVSVDDRGSHTRHFTLSREYMPMYAEMAASIREHGAVPAVELCHDGQDSKKEVSPGVIIGPNDFVRADGVHVKGMTEDDMNEVIDAFCKAIDFWEEAGFEAFIIHMAHGWLFPQFLSPLTNHRRDEYGGSPENRMRFPLMALEKIRAYKGPNTVIELRLSGSDRDPDGFDVDFAIDFLEKAQEYVDIAEISSEKSWNFMSTYFRPRMLNVDLSEAIKASKRIHIPIFTVGAILDPDDAEEIIVSGRADGVSMIRGLIADPFFPKKAASGRKEDIAPCVRCCTCTANDTTHLHFICSVNPLISRECRVGYTDTITKAARPQKVLIAGGGPAGMQAALTARMRGHEVILAEKEERLGGMLNFTDRDVIKTELKRYKDFLVNKTLRSGIQILYNTEVSKEIIEQFEPDVLLIGTGSKPVVPTFLKGYEKAWHASDIYFAPEKATGERYVIIGGGLIGIEAGLNLRKQGKQVVVLEKQADFAPDANRVHRKSLDVVIPELELDIVLNADVQEVLDHGVRYLLGGKEIVAEGDVVLYAVGMKSDHEPFLALSGMAETVLEIGDCKKVGKIDGAIHSGFFAAMDVGAAFL